MLIKTLIQLSRKKWSLSIRRREINKIWQ